MLKKIKTLPVILRLAAAVLAIVAFCMMFGDNLKYVVTGLINNEYVLPIFGDADRDIAAVPSVIIGYILILVGGLGAAVVAFLFDEKKKMLDLVVVAAAVVMMIVGAIMVFCVPDAFVAANGDGSFSAGSWGAGTYECAPCAVVGGILAIVAALADAAAIVVPMIKK